MIVPNLSNKVTYSYVIRWIAFSVSETMQNVVTNRIWIASLYSTFAARHVEQLGRSSCEISSCANPHAPACLTGAQITDKELNRKVSISRYYCFEPVNWISPVTFAADCRIQAQASKFAQNHQFLGSLLVWSCWVRNFNQLLWTTMIPCHFLVWVPLVCTQSHTHTHEVIVQPPIYVQQCSKVKHFLLG